MVATRSAARKQPAAEAVAPAPTLKAPPKRAAKKAAPKAEPENAPAPAKPEPKKTVAKAKPEPSSEPAKPEPKKAATRAKAALKPELSKPEPKKASAAPKRKRAAEPEPELEPEEQQPPPPKRGRPAAKPKAEPIKVEAAVTTKRTTRAAGKVAAPVSPLKRAARKPPVHASPIKKAPRRAAKVAKPATPVQENPFGDFPNYPTTPAVKLVKPATPVEENPFEEHPQYPSTPAIKGPVKEDDAKPARTASPARENVFSEFPNYPSTPAVNPFGQFPNYPTTPAVNPLGQFPNYPTTPAINPFGEHPQFPYTPALKAPSVTKESEDITEKPAASPAASSSTLSAAPTSPVAACIEESEDVTMEDAPSFTDVEAENTDAEAEKVIVYQSPGKSALRVDFASTFFPTLKPFQPAAIASPIKSALRSPQKLDTKTPKKSVTWNASPSPGPAFDSSLLVTDGPLTGTIFYVDIQSDNGKAQNHLFVGLLEDLGAQVVTHWTSDNIGLTHVLFKDGSPATLQRVAATNGAVKCVNIGWALDCEKQNKRMDEADYAVNLNNVTVSTPAPKKTALYTPARTPSYYFSSYQSPSSVLSTPSTPNSSEWERSMIFDETDEKENVAPASPPKIIQRSCPPKPQTKFSWLQQSPIKSSLFGTSTVARPMQKRKIENHGGITMAPRKLKFI